jgi:WD40 repeat protein
MLLPDYAYELLLKYRDAGSNEIEDAKKICNSVGYLPLAIVLVGGYLNKYNDITIQEYYEEHIKDKLGSIDLDQISNHELTTKHIAAVRATFGPEWNILNKSSSGLTNVQQLIAQTTQNAKKLISILSLLPESAIIPKNRLLIYSGIEKFGKTKLIRPAQSAFNFLYDLNLIDLVENGKSVHMHPLLREFIYEKIVQDEDENYHPDKLKFKSITNLKNRYYEDFSYLVEEYSKQREGNIDSILEDFRTILDWSKNETKLPENENEKKDNDHTTINSILSLYKILEQESHNLRVKDVSSFISSASDKRDKGVIFAQQIHIRATDLGQKEIIQRSREYLQTNACNFFNILWAKVRDKSALIRTLEDTHFVVESVAITPDGSKIVSGSTFDNAIKVWDLASGRIVNTLSVENPLKGDFDSVGSVTITPDGTKIVAGSTRGNTIFVWDLNSGHLLNTLEGHADSVLSVAITPDGTKIVSGSSDNTIKVWDLNNGSTIFACKFDSLFSTIAISKYKQILAVGDLNGALYIIEIV